jgi:hypothetical protein
VADGVIDGKYVGIGVEDTAIVDVDVRDDWSKDVKVGDRCRVAGRLADFIISGVIVARIWSVCVGDGTVAIPVQALSTMQSRNAITIFTILR